MIPQRNDPHNSSCNQPTQVRKGIFFPLDGTGNHFLGIKELAKPLNSSEIHDQWAYMPHLTARYPYESLISPFARGGIIGNRDGYSAFDFSILSSARRKNASRETTSPLKAWLHEHRKNPYPTKGEKIMLAILTKMTLTQISTWFANARRRLKKDNKMTWSPKNKSSHKKDSVLSNSKNDDFDKSISIADDESIDGIEREERDSKLDDDVFSGDEESLCGTSKVLKLTEEHEKNTSENTNASTKSPKLDFAGNYSPVGNLQRWVDGHFGNQSPTDFPRELTPPRTPVGDISYQGNFSGKEFRGENTSLRHELESSNNEIDAKDEAQISKQEISKAPSSPQEDFIRSVTQNENGLQRQFRSCGLTSHREIDAVLALTSLASR